MNDIEIVLLGNRGSGKTTLLATMAHELAMNSFRFKPLVLKPQAEEFKLLNQKWSDQLKRLKTEFSFTGDYAGTQSIIEHPFVFTNGKETQPFCFVDTPGGQTYHSDTALRDRVEKATAVICVVDAVELMEYPLAFAQDRCAVAGLQSLLETATASRSVKCLFVLTKCEKYMHSHIPSENVEALARKFTECFKPVLELEKLVSLYLPVETLGCLEFAGFEGGDDDRRSKWIRTAMEPKPVNIFVPLCFAMWELLGLLKDQQWWFKRLLTFLFGSEEYEGDAAQLLELIGDAHCPCYYDSETKQLVDFSADLRQIFEKVKQNE